MATRFFRKMGDMPVPLSNGQTAKFTSIDGGLSAYIATADEWLAAEFERCMREHRSGISEISYEEFNTNYLQKKTNGQVLKPAWREELSNNRMRVSESGLKARLEAAQAVVAVAEPPPARSAPEPLPATLSQAAVNQLIVKELPKAEDYKPEVGKRRKAKAA